MSTVILSHPISLPHYMKCLTHHWFIISRIIRCNRGNRIYCIAIDKFTFAAFSILNVILYILFIVMIDRLRDLTIQKLHRLSLRFKT